ncbi:hypothetical protein PoB_002998100 [Plakobranchus ocellatus]|uniref:Uncharacterized protein n=1 Tax=Plakobranchus ocellatus TaxID=259542 RepID=A0AAV3ZWZ2_9GAST|nr:hypothetical protein PoB_002998100 [Plakobranchus ocellatus]
MLARGRNCTYQLDSCKLVLDLWWTFCVDEKRVGGDQRVSKLKMNTNNQQSYLECKRYRHIARNKTHRGQARVLLGRGQARVLLGRGQARVQRKGESSAG